MFPDIAALGRYRGRKLHIPDDAVFRTVSQAIAQLDQLREFFAGYSISPHTSLAADDTATPDERLSEQVLAACSIAFDNLGGVSALFESPRVPSLAGFALLRGALEAVGMGLWLLSPASRDQRILRSLQTAYESVMDEAGLNAAVEGLPFREPAPDDPKRLRLESLRDSRSSIFGKSLKPPTMSHRLASVQHFYEISPHFQDSGNQPLLLLWKYTSGIAHGRRYAVAAVFEYQVAQAAGNSNRADTSSIVGGIFVQAETYLLRLLKLLQERGGPPDRLVTDAPE
jgi:hypothetical protein